MFIIYGVAKYYGYSMDKIWYWFVICLGFAPFLELLHIGQINVITMFGIFMMFFWESTSSVLSGAGLSLAVITKVSPLDKDSHISGAIDSYYEYLLKCAILFDDQDCWRMWEDSIAAINKYLSDDVKKESLGFLGKIPYKELWYGHSDMNIGKRTATTYGALDAFFPAMLALSGDLNRARLLQNSSYKMWMKHGIEPEEINYTTMEVVSPGYPLRPEIVESTYYLYHYASIGSPGLPTLIGRSDGAVTSREKYQQMGEMMFRDFVKYCRTDEGYAALKSVVTKEKSDSMQSFLFAETFKYFYLLFAPPRTLEFDKVIFNTEAHPIRRKFRSGK